MDITVITPTVPERSHLLKEAIDSVAAQTHPVKGHMIGVDYERLGPSAMRNKLIQPVETEWIAFLDDDDLLDPNHFEAMLPYAQSSDVIYTWCRSTGREGFNTNRHFNEAELREGNYIPITVAMRQELLNDVRGLPEEPLEDWALWLRLLDRLAVFTCVPQITWTYRFFPDGRTFKMMGWS